MLRTLRYNTTKENLKKRKEENVAITETRMTKI